MRNYVRAVSGLLGMLVVSSGCQGLPTTEPTFPKDDVRAVRTAAQFDALVQQAGRGERQPIKLAGRVVSVEVTDRGAVVLATWLPFPRHTSLESAPSDSPSAQGRKFVFLFPGTIRDPFTPNGVYDPAAGWEGNRFLVEGAIAGAKTMTVDAVGEEKPLLSVTARCVHVWETGQSERATQPDSHWAGSVARTFCAAAGPR